MALHWVKEDRPSWDGDKQSLFDADVLAAVGMPAPTADSPIADEWWRVEDAGGKLVGYGWLDSEWGDAQISFVVAPSARGQAAGEFVLDRLEAEAASRGLNYIYNVVPASHPDPQWMTHWLTLHGFFPSTRGDLRRQVRRPAN